MPFKRVVAEYPRVGDVLDLENDFWPHRRRAPRVPHWHRSRLRTSQIARRGKSRDGRLKTRSMLRIVRELGQRVGLHVWCHGLRHTAITTAIEKGQQAGVGLDQIRAFFRHRTLATILIYRDEHDRAMVHRTLADVVANTLTTAAE